MKRWDRRIIVFMARNSDPVVGVFRKRRWDRSSLYPADHERRYLGASEPTSLFTA